MPECSLVPKSYSLFPYFCTTIESKIQSLLTFNFLIFYHSSHIMLLCMIHVDKYTSSWLVTITYIVILY